MRHNKVDTSKWPRRAVVSKREVRNKRDLAYMLTLECGHEVGLREGFDEPTSVPCYFCNKGFAAWPTDAQGT